METIPQCAYIKINNNEKHTTEMIQHENMNYNRKCGVRKKI